MTRIVVRYRSAKTGKFVSKAFAEANPDTTVAETVKEKEICLNISY